MTTQDIVEDFIFTYKHWLDSGAPDGKPFTRCDDLEQNMTDALNTTLGKDHDLIEPSKKLLKNLFRSHGLDPHFPFHQDPKKSINVYIHDWLADVLGDTYHTNKRMLSWIGKITSP